MAEENPTEISYQRARFATRLPTDRRYTAGHYWLRLRAGEEGTVWEVGLTKFATRMLGDLVEYEFEVKPGALVKVGQTLGWIEAFKAVTDIIGVMEGEFVGGNPELESNIDAVMQDPYGKGWLYAVRGQPDAQSVDAVGYVNILDSTIDKMRGPQGGDSPKGTP